MVQCFFEYQRNSPFFSLFIQSNSFYKRTIQKPKNNNITLITQLFIRIQTTNELRVKLPSIILLIPSEVDSLPVYPSRCFFFFVYPMEIDCYANENLHYKLIGQVEVS